MTPREFADELARLDRDEREVLLDYVLAEMTHAEIRDAIIAMWGLVGRRVAAAVAAYREECARIDAQAADDEGIA